MSRIGAVLAAPARALAAVGGAAVLGASMLFTRMRGWGVYLSRTRIDYRSEIGDPSTNSIVGAVVGWIARNLPDSPLRIVRSGTTEVAYAPSASGPGAMLRLLERPNPHYSGLLQMQATIVDYKCSGNSYWLKQRSKAGRVIALWWVPERMMEPRWPENDNRVFISHYDYTIDGRTYWVDPADVIHFRHGIDPRNTRKGLSPLAALFREIFTDDEAANFTASLLRNLGVPGVVISPANTTGPQTAKQDPEVVKQKFMEKFGGDKRGEPLVLTGPTDVKVLSFNPQEMELRSLRRIPEERVSAVLGVPAGVAGLGAGLDRNTFTNYGEANVAAYTQGAIPTQKLLAADLDFQLLPEFAGTEADELDVWFDWTQAAAMQFATDAIWKRHLDAMRAGGITRAAFKRATGQKVEAGDEVYLIANNITLVEAGGNQPPGLALVPGRDRRPQLPPDDGDRASEDEAPEIVAREEARCPDCHKLLGKDVVAARLWCSDCKTERAFAAA